MWILFLALCASVAQAGDIVVDAELPVEIALDGRPTAQVFYAASVRFEASTGEHTVTLMQSGFPTKVVVQVPEGGTARVIVGKSGISTEEQAAPDASGSARVELRVIGDEGMRLTIDGQHYKLSVGGHQTLELSRGMHEVDLSSYNGTLMYAVGKLKIDGTGDVVVHLSAGRAPEVTGTTGRWLSEER